MKYAMQPDIICIGEPMLEFNQLENKNHYLCGHGGDTSNCAVAAARQGAKVGYITALGDDDFGDSFIDLWRAENIDTSQVTRNPAAHTGIYFVRHGPGGHSFSYLRAGSAASRMTIENISENYIAKAKILHVSGISQAISDSACDAVFHAIETARKHRVKVSYDTNLRLQLWPLQRARAVIHAAIAGCDIALPGLDDAIQLTGLDAPDAIADFYLALGVETVALTLGAGGTLVATPSERRHIAPYPVKAVDATAAGDTFDGAFLAELAAGSDCFSAARYANIAAALSTQGYGAVAPIPARKQINSILNNCQTAKP